MTPVREGAWFLRPLTSRRGTPERRNAGTPERRCVLPPVVRDLRTFPRVGYRLKAGQANRSKAFLMFRTA